MEIRKIIRITSWVLALVISFGINMVSNNLMLFNTVEATPQPRTMIVNIPSSEDNTTQSQSRTITIPNLKSIESVSVNTGNVSYSVSGDNVMLNVSGGNVTRTEIKEKDVRMTSDINFKTYAYNRDPSVSSKSSIEGLLEAAGFRNVLVEEITSGDPYDIDEIDGYTSSTGDYWVQGPFNRCRDSVAYFSYTWKQTVYTHYYSYKVTIEYIDNSDPETTLTSPTNNNVFSENDGYNNINISGTAKDEDISDIFSVRYELANETNVIIKSGTLLQDKSSNNGQEYSFDTTISVDETIAEGMYTLKIIGEDDKGGVGTKNITIHIDKTGSVSTIEVKALSTNKIEIKVTATDIPAGVKTENTYQYNRDNEDILDWTGSNTITDENLKPNRKYTYKVKAIDKVDNIGEYSSPIAKYTLANNPDKVQFIKSTMDSLTFNIVNNDENVEKPETKLIAKKKGSSVEFKSTNWSMDEEKTIEELVDGTEYDIYIDTRNGDKVPNGEVKLGSNEGEIPLVDENGNPLVDENGDPLDYIITAPKKPIITEVISLKNESANKKEITVKWNAPKSATKYALYVIPEGEERELIKDDIEELEYTHENLTPNREYEYILQAGNINGFSIDSDSVKRHTQALSVKGVRSIIVAKNKPNSIEFKVKDVEGNYKVPETRIEIWDKENNLVSYSDFIAQNEERLLDNLEQFVEYEVWAITRNCEEVGGNKITNDRQLIFNSVYTNRPPILQEVKLSEGNHHKGKPLKIYILSKEFDIGDEINVMYSMTGMLDQQNNQILRPLSSTPYNYKHDTTITEYEGFIDFTGEELNGIYEITFWIEDNNGLESGEIAKTYKIVIEDYYLEELKDIAENGTDEELKEALEKILGDEFDDLYFPDPLPEHMTEEEYLDIIRDEISKLDEPITKDKVRRMIALVNINCRLSYGIQSTIPKLEIVIVLDDEAHRYIDNYLPDYQKELKRMYGDDGKPIMRLDEIDVLNAIKLVNFNKLPIKDITKDILEDLIGDKPPVNEDLLEDYKDAIEELRENNPNPTLEDIIDAIETVNINDKIDKGTLTEEEFRRLFPNLRIYPGYWNEYLRYLKMYKIDLGRRLNKDDIEKVIEAVNGVIDYEKNNSDANYDNALENINKLVDGSVKDELTDRILPLKPPVIDTEIYENKPRDSIYDILDSNSNDPSLIEIKGKKTIISNIPIIDMRIIEIIGATHIRYLSQENNKDSYERWISVNSPESMRKLTYNNQGIYLAGVQAKNDFKQSEIEDINIVIDWTAPKGSIIKKNPSQTVTKESYITLKVVAEDNIKMPMYVNINGTWQELTNDFFNYYIGDSEGEVLIEIALSDTAGNKTYLYDKIWKIN